MMGCLCALPLVSHIFTTQRSDGVTYQIIPFQSSAEVYNEYLGPMRRARTYKGATGEGTSNHEDVSF